MKNELRLLRVKLENMKSRAIKERADLLARIREIDDEQATAEQLLAMLDKVTP